MMQNCRTIANDARALSPANQQGVALMIVILVFALVTILSVGMYSRQSLFIQQASNISAQTQAYQYALSAEEYGRIFLKDDWDDDKKNSKFVDDLTLLEESFLFPVDDAIVEAQWDDVQGRLNINDLVTLNGVPNTVMIDRFNRLLSRLNLATPKLAVLIDWLDEDPNPYSFDGAEDGDYQRLAPPYRTSTQSFVHESELRLMLDLSHDDYLELNNYIVMLPRGYGHTNVNTAPPEVLQALIVNLTDKQAEELIEARDKEAWESLAEFKDEPALAGLTVDETYLGVHSVFFELATRITFSDRVARLKSLIYRAQSDGKMTVIQRDQGQKYLITKQKSSLGGSTTGSVGGSLGANSAP